MRYMAATMPSRRCRRWRWRDVSSGWLVLMLMAPGAWAQAGRSAATLASAEVSACLAAAAGHHAVDPAVLHAIASVESGFNPQAINRTNRNGSRDIGLMQINSSWLPTLARWDITETQLFDPCVSAYVGAWILAGNMARMGHTWRAVGAYNARTPARQVAYVRRVQEHLARLRGSAPAGQGGNE